MVFGSIALAIEPNTILVQSQQTSLGKRKRNWGHPKPRQGRTPGPPFPSTSRDFALVHPFGNLLKLLPRESTHCLCTHTPLCNGFQNEQSSRLIIRSLSDHNIIILSHN